MINVGQLGSETASEDYLAHQASARMFGDPRNVADCDVSLPGWMEVSELVSDISLCGGDVREYLGQIHDGVFSQRDELLEFFRRNYSLSEKLPSININVDGHSFSGVRVIVSYSVKGRATSPHTHGKWSFSSTILGLEMSVLYSVLESRSGFSIDHISSLNYLGEGSSVFQPSNFAHSIYIKTPEHIGLVVYGPSNKEGVPCMDFESLDIRNWEEFFA